jgi:hypothetical protein
MRDKRRGGRDPKGGTMERLYISNIAPGTSDDELKALVAKYARDPMECIDIKRIEGDGSHPAALMSFTGKKLDTLAHLAVRLNGMYWKGRELGSSTTLS